MPGYETGPEGGIEDVIEASNLQRDNALLLKVVGGLGIVIFSLTGAILTFWLNSISGKFDSQQNQLSKQWDVLNQRAERIANLENRVTGIDTLTKDQEKLLRDLDKDHSRMKFRLRMDN